MGGNACSKGFHSSNRPVAGGNNYDKPPPDHMSSHVYVLMCALDYKQTDNPLTCTMDARNMQDLLTSCNIPPQNITMMLDEQCTNENVKAKIQQVSSCCTEDDYFVFYYSGHGTNVDDVSGDEADGQDEAFCFVDQNGQISYETIMTDDDFADVVTSVVPPGTRILILTDCCHSGTICDLSKPCWDDYEVLSITGCMDSQTSGDVGTGGIFTHSMLMAIEKLQSEGEDEYSAGTLYNATLAYDDKVFSSAQDITINANSETKPDTFAWPLIPTSPYTSPMGKAGSSAGGAMTYGAPEPGAGLSSISSAAAMLAANPQMAQQLGISPQLLQLAASGLGDGDLDMAHIAKMGKHGCSVM